MRLPDEVLAEYVERARHAAEIRDAEKIRYKQAVEALEAAKRDYDEAKNAARDAENRRWSALNGDVPLKDGSWLNGEYAAAHPDVLRDEYLHVMVED